MTEDGESSASTGSASDGTDVSTESGPEIDQDDVPNDDAAAGETESRIDVSDAVAEASESAAEHVSSPIAVVSPSPDEDPSPDEGPGASGDEDSASATNVEDSQSSDLLTGETHGDESDADTGKPETHGHPGVETRGTPIAAVAVVKLRRAWRNAKRTFSSLRQRPSAQEAEPRDGATESAPAPEGVEASSEASVQTNHEGASEQDDAAQADRSPAAAAAAPERNDVEEAEHDRGTVVIESLSKRYGENYAVDDVSLSIPAGSFYGIVGPNGAGKTTTLSMMTGLLRPDAGQVRVNGIDVWKKQAKAKRTMGVLPDRMRLFDRLTGAQLLYYSGVLRGLDNVTVRARVQSLARAFGLEDAIGRLVSDYSVGMSKKVALASALIHSPRVLVLDEPFESVDPVSAASITEILQKYVENGGTVILSSHGMEFIERVCDKVAVIVGGKILASGTVDEVREDKTLEERLVELVGGLKATEDLEWLHSFSD